MPKTRPWSEFGRQIKARLLEIDQTQEWLIAEARKLTSKYIDSSNLYKIMTGQYESPEIELAIRSALGIDNNQKKGA